MAGSVVDKSKYTMTGSVVENGGRMWRKNLAGYKGVPNPVGTFSAQKACFSKFNLEKHALA